jgi:DNA-directed RNA polymerase subunit M/transcription elongation factor TFIIS
MSEASIFTSNCMDLDIDQLRVNGKNLLTKYFDEQIACCNTKFSIHDLEVMIHQKALQLQNEQSMAYNQAYINVIMDIWYMIQHFHVTAGDAVEQLLNNQINWDCPMFNKFVDNERRDIMNMTKPLEIEEGIYTCPKCKGKKTNHYSRQMRSADEPATTFITCANKDCQYKWSIN